MTGLLVSVRNAAEAKIALLGGADVIDVKEPSRGALGAADAEVWEDVVRVVAGQAPVSVALGELLSAGIEERAKAATVPMKFAKIGLAGCHQERGWLVRYGRVMRALSANVEPVPVAYADWAAAKAPSPSVALALAARTKERMLLIDTYDKSRGCLLDHLALESLAELANAAREWNVCLALAGSLTAASIRRVLSLSPAYVGVRGAVCPAGRRGAIELSLVKALSALLASSPRNVAS